MFPIIRVDSRSAEQLEPLGTKPKFWYRDGGRRILFKAEERGTGEDWAEKIACELCTLLGLPHVHYELAVDVAKDIPGVVCETCAPPPLAMGLGNQLLQALDPDYPEGRKYKVRQHTVAAVTEVLELLLPPPVFYSQGMPAGIDSAQAVFVGYVMLDAWIANQDRHHENWAALRAPGELTSANLYLAPTFDHGASMARNLTDEERTERLASRDGGRQIPAFVRRARSAFYADAAQAKPMTTMEAWLAFSRMTPQAAKIWIDKLRCIDSTAVQRVLDEAPPHRMSQLCRQFTLELLMENQRRLVDEESQANE
jgi:hypothetical protein